VTADFSKFTEEQKAYIRDSFVENECDTDEYRETQPVKGMNYYAQLLEMTEDGSPEEQKELIELGLAWHKAMVDHWGEPGWRSLGYAGADELRPILTKLFDLMWSQGETPYGDSVEELLERWQEGKDD
jgi:hypothetical protein